MFKILDRYILKDLVGPFAFGILSFTCILAGSTVLFILVGDAVKFSIPVIDTIRLFVYKLPGIIVFTFPMAMLLSSILVFGRLSSDLEIIAFRAGGVSVLRLVIPVIAVGIIVSVLTIWFNESVVPKSSHYAAVLMNSFKSKNKPDVRENINITQYDAQGLPLRIINVPRIENGLLRDLTVAEYEEGHLARLIKSESGEWLDHGGWAFYDGVMHNLPRENPKRVVVIEFEKELINIKVNPYDFASREKNVEEMTAKELQDRIALKRQTGQNALGDLVRFHMKFSVPFASLIFAILGSAVGVRPHRSSSARGFGLSLVIIIGYYILLAICQGLGLSGVVPPYFAAWLPNIAVGFVALFQLRQVTYQ